MNIDNLILKIVTIFTILSLSYTCEDFIDLQPLDDVSSDSYWKEASHLDFYVRRFYNYFPSNGNYFPIRVSDKVKY